MKDEGKNTMRLSEILIPIPIETGTLAGICAICARDSDNQLPLSAILEKTSANLTAQLDLTKDTVCPHCVGVWREPKKWHRGILATSEKILFPVIAKESATANRPTWSAAIRELDTTLPRVAILTTDAKKRVWTFARVSQGETLSIYLYDPSRCLSGNVSARMCILRDTLNRIEEIYLLGFTKNHIQQSLLSYQKLAQQIGIRETIEMERELIPLRSLPEFLPALIVAQKQENK